MRTVTNMAMRRDIGVLCDGFNVIGAESVPYLVASSSNESYKVSVMT